MIRVPLVGKFVGMYALVDDQDAWVLKFRWKGMKGKSGIIYARVSSGKDGLNNKYLHRLILGLKKGDPDVDHIDGDGLNNQKYNLRLATNSQNNMNQKKPKGSYTSIYKGVRWHKGGKKWQASIRKDGKLMHIGCYISEVEAGKAYDKKARGMFGEYARLNFPESKEFVNAN